MSQGIFPNSIGHLSLCYKPKGISNRLIRNIKNSRYFLGLASFYNYFLQFGHNYSSLIVIFANYCFRFVSQIVFVLIFTAKISNKILNKKYYSKIS